MKSRKISQHHAQQIATRITNLAFEAEVAIINARADALAKRVRAAIITDEQEAAIRAMRPHLQVGLREEVAVDCGPGRLRYREFKIDPPVFCNTRYLGITELGSDLHADILAYHRARSDAHDRQVRLAQEILANITTASTTGRLIESWPESKPIILEIYGDAPEVETPLEAILGRYLAPALPAPEAQPAKDDEPANDEQANG
jgi:hypothetical protein